MDEHNNPMARTIVPPATCGWHLCTWSTFFETGGYKSSWLPQVLAAIAGSQITVMDSSEIWFSMGEIIQIQNQNADRPIGLETRSKGERPEGLSGWFLDKLVILSREKIESALAAGKNTIEVRFWDRYQLPNQAPTKNPLTNGDYTLVIKIERP